MTGCFVSLSSQATKRRKALPKHDPGSDVRPDSHLLSVPMHMQRANHTSSFNLRREEKKDYTVPTYFRGRRQETWLCLIFCNECVTPDDICFSARWVAFTFTCTIRSKGSGHTQGDTELEVKPWNKVHGSRSGLVSRPFTERCEKGAGCRSKVWVFHHVRKGPTKKPGVNLLLLGGLNGSLQLSRVFTAFLETGTTWAAVG